MKNFLLLATFLFFSATSFSQKVLNSDSLNPLPVVVQEADINDININKLKTLLNTIPSKYYKFERVSNNNKKVSTIGNGNAEIQSLKAQTVYSAPGTKSIISPSNMIQVKLMKAGAKMSDYIRLVWTSDALKDVKDKVAEVNKLLSISSAQTPLE